MGSAGADGFAVLVQAEQPKSLTPLTSPDLPIQWPVPLNYVADGIGVPFTGSPEDKIRWRELLTASPVPHSTYLYRGFPLARWLARASAPCQLRDAACAQSRTLTRWPVSGVRFDGMVTVSNSSSRTTTQYLAQILPYRSSIASLDTLCLSGRNIVIRRVLGEGRRWPDPTRAACGITCKALHVASQTHLPQVFQRLPSRNRMIDMGELALVVV